MIRLLVVDDQPWVRVGLKALLELEEDFSVVGECDSGEATLEWLAGNEAEVVLLDIRMPGLGGIKTAEVIGQRYPQTGVILLTTFEEEEDMIAGLRTGAAGYLLKDVSVETLTTSIRRVAAGERIIQPRIPDVLAEALYKNRQATDLPPETLTPRELEILTLIAQGLSNKDIAKALNLSAGTVKVHVSRVLSKLAAADRSEAVARSLEWGLLQQS